MPAGQEEGQVVMMLFLTLQIRQKAKAGEQLPVGSMKIPMVDLPLGATEDRVCGTIDIEKALTEGEWVRQG
jgi:Mg-chelatase subunit ChlI